MGFSFATFFQVLYNLRTVTDFHLVAITLFLYDYLLTVGMEVRYIWSDRWNTMKILFLVQRYMPFIDTVYLILARRFGPQKSIEHCRIIIQASSVMFVIGVTFCEAILSIRVWAVWNRSRKLAWALGILSFACAVNALYWEYSIIRTIKLIPQPLPLLSSACFITGIEGSLSFCWILILGYEAILLILMLIATVRAMTSGPTSKLATVVYRDGTIYYIYLFVLSVINVVVSLLFPQELSEILYPLERVAYSVLTSRVILHIREHSDMDNILVTMDSEWYVAPQGGNSSMGSAYPAPNGSETQLCRVPTNESICEMGIAY